MIYAIVGRYNKYKNDHSKKSAHDDIKDRLRHEFFKKEIKDLKSKKIDFKI